MSLRGVDYIDVLLTQCNAISVNIMMDGYTNIHDYIRSKEIETVTNFTILDDCFKSI